METPFVLLVEDNADDVTLMLRIFARTGLPGDDRVVVTRDGVEALDFLFPAGADHSRAARPLPRVYLPRSQDAAARRARGTAPRPRGYPHEARSRGHAHIVGRGARRDPELPARRQQLYPEAGGLDPVLGDGGSAGTVLVSVESGRPGPDPGVDGSPAPAAAGRGLGGRRRPDPARAAACGLRPDVRAGADRRGDEGGARPEALGSRDCRLCPAALQRPRSPDPRAGERARSPLHRRVGCDRRRNGRPGHARRRARLHHEGQSRPSRARDRPGAARGRSAARAEGARRAAPAGAEDGGDRPAGRRRGPRLQQPADGHHRLLPSSSSTVSPSTEPSRREVGARSCEAARAGRRAHPAAAGLQPQAGARAPACRISTIVVAEHGEACSGA